jgi:hypothetical protein
MAKLYTHNKRGGLYEIITASAHLQCSTEPRFEEQFNDQPWVVYRNVQTGGVYLRLNAEFFSDNRFTLVSDSDG